MEDLAGSDNKADPTSQNTPTTQRLINHVYNYNFTVYQYTDRTLTLTYMMQQLAPAAAHPANEFDDISPAKWPATQACSTPVPATTKPQLPRFHELIKLSHFFYDNATRLVGRQPVAIRISQLAYLFVGGFNPSLQPHGKSFQNFQMGLPKKKLNINQYLRASKH